MANDTFKAIAADVLGPPENYEIRDYPVVEPDASQVRVRIMAAGIGYADELMARGGYQLTPPTPYVPGAEFSGIVEAVGASVTRFKAGDRVCGFSMGGALAELGTVEEGNLYLLPESLGFAAGASFLVNYQTSFYALKQRGQLAPGETLLVLGAAGGVGSAAVELGKLMGATVIAAASSEEKRSFTLGIGADHAVDYTRADWRDELKSLTGGKGVDVVYDPVGGATFEAAFRSLAWRGRHLVIGFVGGPIPKLPANLPLLKGAALVGVDIRQFGIHEPEEAAKNTELLWQWCREGRLNPPVGPVFPFARFREALHMAASGKALGKVVLAVGEEG